MTITGSFPSNSVSQVGFIDLVNQTFKNLEAKSSVVTVHGSSEPPESTLQAQWASQIPYAPPQNGSILNWFNPITGKVIQAYYPNASGAGNLVPYVPKPTNSGMDWLADWVVGANGILDTTGFTIPSTYRHLLVTFSVRGAAAGVAVESVKLNLNAVVTATHSYVGSLMDSGTTPIVFSATAVANGYVGTSIQNNVTDQAQAAVGHFWIPNANVTVSGFRQVWAHSTCLVSNARPYTKRYVRVASFLPVTAAVTRIQLQAGTGNNWVRGSRMTLYGVK